MKSLASAAALTSAMALIGATSAQATVVVVGGLSNFDVSTNTGKDEFEFDIELPSVDPTEISSLWNNTHTYKGHDYVPTDFKAASSDGIAGHTSTYVTYKNAAFAPGFTPNGFVEHFGIHFANALFQPTNTIYTWKDQLGHVTDSSLPSLTATTVANGAGGTSVLPTVTNNTANTVVVQLHAVGMTTATPVELDQLTDVSPEVVHAESEVEPGSDGNTGVVLHPGEVLGVDGEAHDPTDPIILNPQAWLATHHTEGQTIVANLNNPGDAAVLALSIGTFDGVDVNGNPISNTRLSNVFSALNTVTPVPLPAGLGLFGSGIAGITVLRRKRT